jgi:hypothetical protein
MGPRLKTLCFWLVSAPALLFLFFADARYAAAQPMDCAPVITKIQHPGTIRLRNSSTHGDQTAGSTSTKPITLLVELVDGPNGTCPETSGVGILGQVGLTITPSDGGIPPDPITKRVTLLLAGDARLKFDFRIDPTSCAGGAGPVPKDQGGTNALSTLTYLVTATASQNQTSATSIGELLCKPSRSGRVEAPPTVSITSPVDGAIVNATPILVSGIAGNADDVTVNGEVATLSGEDFEASVHLDPGPNAITARATNPFGESTDTIQVTFELPPGPEDVMILVPPDGTVTDFEAVTVVGTLSALGATVSVEGVPASVIDDRFVARGVPLGAGVNSITAVAMFPGGDQAANTVSVERSAQPVLDVALFSPPADSLVPGGGLVVRGFVSAKNARTLVSWAGAPEVREGVFELTEVFPDAGAQTLQISSETADASQTATDAIPIQVATKEPALGLLPDPASGAVPFTTALTAFFQGAPFDITRIDFDLDGDGSLDVIGSPSPTQTASVTQARIQTARVFVTTPEGVELATSAAVSGHLPSAPIQTLAEGNPVDLASDAEGHLYVLDGAAGTVSRYSADGALELSFGSSGSGPGQLSAPAELTVGPDGRVYVCDTGNGRVQVFLSDGAFDRTIGQLGSGIGELLDPRGILVQGQTLLVSDTGNGRVQFFSLETDQVTSLFNVTDPRGLADASGGGVLVAGPSLPLVALYDQVASFPSTLGSFPPQGQLSAPVDVAVGPDGVTIADPGTGQLVLLTRNLTYRRSVELGGLSPLAVQPGLRGSTESIYVADGSEVIEIALPVPPPLPVFTGLRDHLAAGDVEAALELIHPLRRALYAEMYEALGDRLAADAAAMGNLETIRVREGRATLLIHRVHEVDGRNVVTSFPVTMVRAEDGGWWIFDY